MKRIITLITTIAFVFSLSLGMSQDVYAVDNSVSISAATIAYTDADSNSIADIGDTVTITATVSNTDGNGGNVVTADMSAYGGTSTQALSLTTDNSGTADVYTLAFVIVDAGGSGIDVAANNAASAVTVTADDADDTGVETLSTGNLNAAVDTTQPTNQNTIFASGLSTTPGASVTIVSSGDATNDVWLAPSGTTVFSAGATMTTAASGTATTILAPATTGQYKLFVLDDAGNLSSASTATLGVANNGGGGGNSVMSGMDDDNDDQDDDNDDMDEDDDMEMEDDDNDGGSMAESASSAKVMILTKVLRSDLSLQAKIALFKLFSGMFN